MTINIPTTDGQRNLNPSQDFLQSLSIDNLVFRLDFDRLKILLVRHPDPKHEGRWALPGGWVRRNENLDDAAYRALKDLTGVTKLYLEQLKAFDRSDRFPNDRVVTIAYYALVRAEHCSLIGHNVTDVKWYNANDLPALVYDHAEIVAFGLDLLRHKIRHQPIGFNLLPNKFTLLQLQALYEAILNTKLDKSNFRRKIMTMDLLIPCEEKQQDVSHRAALFYRFDPDTYKKFGQLDFHLNCSNCKKTKKLPNAGEMRQTQTDLQSLIEC